MIAIKELRKQDYKKAQRFAIQGMHLNWYVEKGFILELYSKYFWHMELNRTTKSYGAYIDNEFVGVLLADMRDEAKQYHSFWRSVFVRCFDILQHIVAGNGVNEYDGANQEMFFSFCRNHVPDGEIIFLAADPECKVKGIGTALLSAFEADESGKLIYLYTDSACTYQFYEHRGFEKAEEKDVILELNHKRVHLKCLLYSKMI